MSEFKFGCPKCGQHLQCDERLAGRQIECPGCHYVIRIPPAPGKTAQYQAESGMTWATFIGSGKADKVEGLSIGRKDKPPKAPPE
jgi:hypothetical protein